MKMKSTSIIALPLSLGLLFFLTKPQYKNFFRGAKSHIPTLARPFCFIYDRPPHSGSTTICGALRACMSSIGIKQPMMTTNRTNHIPTMLTIDRTRIGILTRHVHISSDMVRNVHKRCGKIFYFTSAKPMRKRVWSAIKFQMIGKNGQLSVQQVAEAKERVRTDNYTEEYLEMYPYVTVQDPSLVYRVPTETIEPDYVIRSERMEEDLGNLLGAFGCRSTFKSKNIHYTTKVANTSDFVQNITLRYHDRLYLKMSKYAKGNASGLRKLKSML